MKSYGVERGGADGRRPLCGLPESQQSRQKGRVRLLYAEVDWRKDSFFMVVEYSCYKVITLQWYVCVGGGRGGRDGLTLTMHASQTGKEQNLHKRGVGPLVWVGSEQRSCPLLFIVFQYDVWWSPIWISGLIPCLLGGLKSSGSEMGSAKP